VRLVYCFTRAPHIDRVRSCEIVQHEAVGAASDHVPLLSEIQ
jgi:hypothetical protein